MCPASDWSDFKPSFVFFVAAGLQSDVEERTLSHPILQEELVNPKNGDSAHKHLKQQVRTNTDCRSDEQLKSQPIHHALLCLPPLSVRIVINLDQNLN